MLIASILYFFDMQENLAGQTQCFPGDFKDVQAHLVYNYFHIF